MDQFLEEKKVIFCGYHQPVNPPELATRTPDPWNTVQKMAKHLP